MEVAAGAKRHSLEKERFPRKSSRSSSLVRACGSTGISTAASPVSTSRRSDQLEQVRRRGLSSGLAFLCALVVVVCALISPARALSVEAAYLNLDYTSSVYFVMPSSWQLVAARTNDLYHAVPPASGTGSYMYDGWEVTAESTFRVDITNTFNNLNTSWANPYYVQMRQYVTFTWNAITETAAASNINEGEPVFEIVDAFIDGYLVENVRLADTNVVNGTDNNARSVRLTIDYTYINGARTGNTIPTASFTVKCRQGFTIASSTVNYQITNRKPTVSNYSIQKGYGRQRDISDYEPFMEQNANNLNAIAGAIVSDQVAGDVLDGANQDFIGAAASLEADQAVLEGAADASLAAVDYNKITMLGTYSQSVGFWGQIISALPSVTAAFWEVLVFGFLIAFLVFILRLVK